MSGFRRVVLERGAAADLAAELRPQGPEADVAGVVAGLIADVRRDGDAALLEQTRRFDCPEFAAAGLRVPADQLEEAAEALAPALREAILTSAAQVRTVAEALRPRDVTVDLTHGQRVRVRAVAVDAAGLYVPGGRASYPSSVVMTAVPAQVAGVGRLAVVSPPGRDGRVAEVVRGAAALLGIDEVYAAGGAGAVAALAYGTETIAPVAVVTGPGNAWVQEAKRQVAGVVGIEGLAGPSEVMIVVDAGADPAAVAADLLAQAEHGADSPAVVASDDAALLAAIEAELVGRPEPAGSIALVRCAGIEDALELAEALAPEHLQIDVAGGEALADRVRNAGAVFLGRNGSAAFGDYVAGSNHVLPTGGAARHASALGPGTYMRRMSVVEMSQAAVDALTPHLVALAEAEGFPMHCLAAELRAGR